MAILWGDYGRLWKGRTAVGLYLGRAGLPTGLREKEAAGGYLRHIELVVNYPGFAGGTGGPKLAATMMPQTERDALTTEITEVTGIEIFSGRLYVR